MPLEHWASPKKQMTRRSGLVDDVIDPVESEKADEDQVDCYREAHDPGCDHQKHSRDQGSDRQQRIASGEVHSSNIADSDAHLARRPRVFFRSRIQDNPVTRANNPSGFEVLLAVAVLLMLKLTTRSHLTAGCIRIKENPAVARVRR